MSGWDGSNSWNSDNSDDWEYWVTDISNGTKINWRISNGTKQMKVIFEDGTEIWIDEEDIKEYSEP